MQCELAQPSIFYLRRLQTAVHLTRVLNRHLTRYRRLIYGRWRLLFLFSALFTLLILLLHFKGSLRLFANDIEHAILECLLVLIQKVLLPVVLRRVRLQIVSSQAMLKKLHAVFVVGLFLEL